MGKYIKMEHVNSVFTLEFSLNGTEIGLYKTG